MREAIAGSPYMSIEEDIPRESPRGSNYRLPWGE